MVWFSSGNSVSITLRQDIADIYTKVALHCHATTTCIDDYVYYPKEMNASANNLCFPLKCIPTLVEADMYANENPIPE
jgi:hypothetical protein